MTIPISSPRLPWRRALAALERALRRRLVQAVLAIAATIAFWLLGSSTAWATLA